MQRAGAGWLILVIAFALALVPTSDLVISILNWDVMLFFPPRLLPRMETEKEIPEEALTMVVVPTIFFSEDQIHSLLEKLEVHFLANQDPQLHSDC